MKQDEYSTANQLWRAGATEVQQLNPGEPYQRLIEPTVFSLCELKVIRGAFGKYLAWSIFFQEPVNKAIHVGIILNNYLCSMLEYLFEMEGMWQAHDISL